MNRSLITALCLLASLQVVGSYAWCDSIPQSRVSEEQTEETPDTRLIKKVSLAETSITLEDLLKKLTEQTGVSCSVDTKASAWSVRERKIHLAVKEMPLGELQIALKKMLMYSWKRTGTEGSWNYILYQSEADKLKEARLRNDRLAERQQERTVKTQNAIAKYQQISAMTPDQAAKIRESDPMGYLMATWPPMRSMSNILQNLPPGTIEQVSSGGSFSIAYRDMPPQMRQDVRNFLNGAAELVRKVDPNRANQMQNISGQQLRNFVFTMQAPAGNYGPMEGQFMANIQMKGFIGNMPIPYPDSMAAKAMGKAVVGVLDGKSMEDLRQEMMQGNLLAEALNSQAESVPQTYSENKPPKDPLLLAEVQISSETGKTPFPDLIKKLSEELKIPMICDDYPGINLATIPGLPQVEMNLSKQPLYKILNTIGGRYNRTWTKRGNVIIWQDPDWFIKRTWDVPHDWIAYFKNQVKQNPNLSLDDQIRLVSFTDEQLMNTFTRETDLARFAFSIIRFRDPLSLYNSLSSNQKSQACSENGLSVSRLNENQWNLLVKIFNNENPSQLERSVIRCRTENNPPVIELTSADGQKSTNGLGMPIVSTASTPAPGTAQNEKNRGSN